MSLEDAANTIVYWLRCTAVSIAPSMFAKETEECHIQVTVQQMTPDERRRVFELAPLDVPDCYEVRELEAA
jgi:hypothetical protein